MADLAWHAERQRAERPSRESGTASAPRFPSDEALTQEEQKRFREDQVLRHADAIRERRKLDECTRTASQKKLIAKLKRTRLAKRCRECGAMKFYLESGRKK